MGFSRKFWFGSHLAPKWLRIAPNGSFLDQQFGPLKYPQSVYLSRPVTKVLILPTIGSLRFVAWSCSEVSGEKWRSPIFEKKSCFRIISIIMSKLAQNRGFSHFAQNWVIGSVPYRILSKYKVFMSIWKKPHVREKSRSRIISIIMSKLAQNRDFSTSKTLFFHLSHRIGLISHIMQVLNG